MRVERVLGGVDVLPIDDAVITMAMSVGDDALRSLDAIHLATALHTGLADTLVTYDHRLATAARAAGSAVVAPGA